MDCPICKETVVVPFGPKTSQVLIIRSSVNEKEPHTRPFNDRTGNILRTEMYNAGLNLLNYRTAVLYNHNIRDECAEFCQFQIQQELKDKKLIVLVGADAVSYFTAGLYGIDDVKGLDISDEISTEFNSIVDFDTVWIAIENPGVSYVKGVGELRLGISNMNSILETLSPF